MAIFLLGELSIYLLYPLLIPIARVIKNKTITLFEDSTLNKYPITSTGLMFFAELLGGCLYWCTYSSTHFDPNKANNELISVKTINLIEQVTVQSKLFTAIHIWSIIGLALLELIGSLSFYTFGTAEFNYLMMTVQIILYACLAYKILHIKVYYHQYLSIALIIIGVILVNIQMSLEEIKWYWIPIAFVSYSLFAFVFIYQKKLMQIKYSPLLLLFCAGVIGFSLCVIIMLGLLLFCPSKAVSNVVCIDLSFYSMAKMDDFYYSLVYIAFTAVLNISILQTNYFFMPTWLVVSDVLSSLMDWIVACILGNKVSGWSIAGYIIIIIGSLVYNEIVILNFCRMADYTRTMINKRSLNETSFCKHELLQMELTV